MRVIAGSARGTRLVAPATSGTRPTTDLVKGAIFSMIAPHAPFPRILDLYAGSGALAIEALSRWQGTAIMVDDDAQACAAMRRNLERTNLTGFAQVQRRPVASMLNDALGPFDLILADPPYADAAIVTTLEQIGRRGVLGPNGVVVLEHGVRFVPEPRHGTLSLWKSRRHGDSMISLFVPSDAKQPDTPTVARTEE